MKKITLTFLLLGAFASKAQEVKKDTVKVDEIEQLKETLNNHSAKFDGYDERLSEMGSTLDRLKSIKVSGYVQAQYEMYDNWSADGKSHGVAPTSGQPLITNSFFLRRARVKFTYEAIDGIKFVLCPNFDIDKVSLKDAFVQLNDRWKNTYSLTVGQFNRPTYEVEYSSQSREFAERSLMTRTLYPSERDQGAKLEADFNTRYNFPLKIQAAVFNGNFGTGAISNQAKDVDNGKDFMGRAVYSLRMANQGLGIDFGGHTYLGNTTVIALDADPTKNVFKDVNNNSFTATLGQKMKKELFGAEVQVYYDFLGGMSLKTEYIRGTYSGTTNASQVNSLFNANKVRNVEGYYVSLIKTIGSRNEASVRYDMFDPNTKLSDDAVKTKDDLKYNTWTFAWQYFFDDNIKIMACYNMPFNEKSANAGADFKTDKRDNTFTLRLQASF